MRGNPSPPVRVTWMRMPLAEMKLEAGSSDARYRAFAYSLIRWLVICRSSSRTNAFIIRDQGRGYLLRSLGVEFVGDADLQVDLVDDGRPDADACVVTGGEVVCREAPRVALHVCRIVFRLEVLAGEGAHQTDRTEGVEDVRVAEDVAEVVPIAVDEAVVVDGFGDAGDVILIE